MPTHKYFMLHYIANPNFTGDHIFRTDSPNEMLKALRQKYERTLQKAQVYAVFCLEEKTQEWKGFDFDGAIEYLEDLVNKGEVVMTQMTHQEMWEEMKQGFENDATNLKKLKEGRDEEEQARLSGKIEGINHALERMREYEAIFTHLFKADKGTVENESRV